MEESWKDIKGFEGLYQVSNKRRVKTLEKEVSHSRNKLLKVKRKKKKKKKVKRSCVGLERLDVLIALELSIQKLTQ